MDESFSDEGILEAKIRVVELFGTSSLELTNDINNMATDCLITNFPLLIENISIKFPQLETGVVEELVKSLIFEVANRMSKHWNGMQMYFERQLKVPDKMPDSHQKVADEFFEISPDAALDCEAYKRGREEVGTLIDQVCEVKMKQLNLKLRLLKAKEKKRRLNELIASTQSLTTHYQNELHSLK